MAGLRTVLALLFLVRLASLEDASAAEPKLNHLFPISGTQGSTTSVAAVEGSEPWPPKVWIDSPGVVFTPGEKAQEWRVAVAPDAKLGPRLVRFYNENGGSDLRFFVVTETQDVLDVEPNDDFHAPQKLSALPAVVSGRLDKGEDVDSYAVQLRKGQALVASLDAYRLGSTFDGLLRIVNASGVQYAFNHDAQTMDPALTWTAPEDGTYIVQVMGFVYPANAEVRFTGGSSCVYRLHLTTGGVLQYSVPMAATRHAKMPLQLVGWNLQASTVEVDATAPGDDDRSVKVAAGSDTLLVPLSECPELSERGEDVAELLSLPIPGAVTGRVNRRDDEDRFLFNAVKGQIYRINLIAAAAGSTLDGWLRIEDHEGKELAAADDYNNSRDPELAWTAPVDGVYRIAVGDVTHRGGDDYFYRAMIVEDGPGVSAVAADHAVKLEAGKSAELKVTVKRLYGFKNKLRLSAKNLPDGISAPEVEVPDAGGEIAIKLEAKPEAASASGPFQLVLREEDGGKEHPVTYSLVNTSENNGVPQGYTSLVIESTDQLWVSFTKPVAK